MNKVFEVIEAKNIFDLNYNNILKFSLIPNLIFMQLVKFK
jgi:1-deoxy-D-xylulose 5-phosphate reductoisomerase